LEKINQSKKMSLTPLHQAASFGDAKRVRKLLNSPEIDPHYPGLTLAPPDLFPPDPIYVNPLVAAGTTEVLRIMINHPRINAAQPMGYRSILKQFIYNAFLGNMPESVLLERIKILFSSKQEIDVTHIHRNDYRDGKETTAHDMAVDRQYGKVAELILEYMKNKEKTK